MQPMLSPYVFELAWHGDIFRFSADNWRDERSAQGHIRWKVRRIDRPDNFPASWETVYAVIEECLAVYQSGAYAKQDVKSFTVEFPSCEAWTPREPQAELVKALGIELERIKIPTGPESRTGHLSLLLPVREEAQFINALYKKYNQSEPLSRNEELALLRLAANQGDQAAKVALESGNGTSYTEWRVARGDLPEAK